MARAASKFSDQTRGFMSNKATLDLTASVHRRLNPLTGDWVLVSPHRTQRPWQGQMEKNDSATLPSFDPGCYLCPGNPRANGQRNPDYSTTYVFDNDFAALLPPTADTELQVGNLLHAQSESGICRVICFSPDHGATLADMTQQGVRAVVDTWIDQYQELGKLHWINAVQVFENRGAMMGASNPHPHGQIWATSSIPNELAKESVSQQQHMQAHDQCLLCEYASLEQRMGERVVCANEHFVAVVPFWAAWPFETLVLPKRHMHALPEQTDAERESLAQLLRRIARGYNAVFDAPFPYTMGIHQAPVDGQEHGYWHWHVHFYPPLLRSATVRKFMVGFEMLAGPQRDISPELAARRLREVMPGA